MRRQNKGVDIVMVVVAIPCIVILNALVGLMDGFRSGINDCRLIWKYINKKG